MTVSGCRLVRHSLALSMCRSQPSLPHGTHGPAPCTRVTLPADWAPLSCHGFALAWLPAGQGPHLSGLVGPNSATVGTPSAAAAWVIAVSGPRYAAAPE